MRTFTSTTAAGVARASCTRVGRHRSPHQTGPTDKRRSGRGIAGVVWDGGGAHLQPDQSRQRPRRRLDTPAVIYEGRWVPVDMDRGWQRRRRRVVAGAELHRLRDHVPRRFARNPTHTGPLRDGGLSRLGSVGAVTRTQTQWKQQATAFPSECSFFQSGHSRVSWLWEEPTSMMYTVYQNASNWMYYSVRTMPFPVRPGVVMAPVLR